MMELALHVRMVHMLVASSCTSESKVRVEQASRGWMAKRGRWRDGYVLGKRRGQAHLDAKQNPQNPRRLALCKAALAGRVVGDVDDNEGVNVDVQPARFDAPRRSAATFLFHLVAHRSRSK